MDEDILDTVRSLFPGAEISLGSRAQGRVSFRLVPGVRSTHMLVPADAPLAAGSAIDRRSAKDTARQVLLRRGVETVLRAPLLSRALMPHVLQVGPSTNSLLDYLERVVGSEVTFSLALGSRRANRKPVLSVHTTTGEEVGFAKVGLTELSNALIDHEAKTLVSLSSPPDLRHFRAPQVIHHGAWGDSRILLMTSLRPTSRRPSQRLPIGAMAELASRSGVHWRPLVSSPWLDTLKTDATRMQEAGHPLLAATIDRYEEAFTSVHVPFGAWHGDLGPWNMAWQESTALVWDWERAQNEVPLGIDSVHFTCHMELRTVGNMTKARDILSGPGEQALLQVLTELEEQTLDRTSFRAILLGYLLALAARFSVDSLRPDGSVVAELAGWYLSVLNDQLNTGD